MKYFLLSLLLLPIQVLAQQTITLNLELLDSGGTLNATLTTSGGDETCDIELYAASKRKRVNNPAENQRIFETKKTTDTIQINAAALRNIKRPASGRTRRAIFFRAGITCNGETSLSDIQTLRLRTRNKGGVTTKRWLSLLERTLLEITVELVEAFPSLSFTQPVDLKDAGDGTNRLFVVGQRGTISVFENDKDTTTSSTFLDIQDKVQIGRELGLLSVAFHPDYETNGFFFVHYSEQGTLDSIIARYKASDDPNQSETEELRLLTIPQPSTIHQGGMMAFGPDGYLYISLGDGGDANDPEKNGQDRGTLLGSILRIDVDNTSGDLNYAIPADNPFVNTAGAREEIFAYGLRNMWKFSFDSTTGQIYGADVGQNRFEEVNIINSGANYGWRTVEGNRCHRPKQGCRRRGLTKPLYVYDHDIGRSITGGYVYRGNTHSSLVGRYIFGDFSNGKIWALQNDNGVRVNQLFDSELLLSSFGTDSNGELYLLNYGEGKVYTFN